MAALNRSQADLQNCSKPLKLRKQSYGTKTSSVGDDLITYFKRPLADF